VYCLYNHKNNFSLGTSVRINGLQLEVLHESCINHLNLNFLRSDHGPTYDSEFALIIQLEKPQLMNDLGAFV